MEDKIKDDVFDGETKKLTTEAEIRACAARQAGLSPGSSAPYTPSKYNEEYRHFDTLIWQMPTWSTAIFLGTAAVIAQNSLDMSKPILGVDASTIVGVFLLAVGGFLIGLTQAVYRFRCHQAPLKKHPQTPWWQYASTALQLLVAAQGFLVLTVALCAFGADVVISGTVMFFCFVWLSGYRELGLRQIGRRGTL